MAGQFVESVYNQIQNDAATVVFIIICSDETQIRTSTILVDALRQDWPEVSDVSMMLNSPWPEGSERSHGCAWALVLVGETVTKECHPGRRACRCDCPAHTANSNVSSNTWCTRKNLCVPRNWEFRHATRIIDVIMLEYPLKVRPMPGIWMQSVPVTDIPWGSITEH